MKLQKFNVVRIGIASAQLPDEWPELILHDIFAVIPEIEYLFRVGGHIGEQIIVERNDDFAFKIFSHPQDIAGCHFIAHTAGVFSIGTKGDIDSKIFAVFGIEVSEMGFARVIDGPSGRFDHIGYGSEVHVLAGRAFK